MKRIRSIATAFIVAISLFGTYSYANPSEDMPSSEEGISASQESAESAKQQDDFEQNDNIAQDNQNKSKQENKRGSKAKDKQSISWLSIIALLLGAGGIALGGLNMKNVNTLQTKLDNLRERNKKTIPDLKGRIEFLEQELTLARKKIEQNQLDISRLSSSIKATSQSIHEQKNYTTQDQPTQQYHQPSSAPMHQTAQEDVKLYCGVPKGGLFSNANRTQSRQSLYVITDNGSNSGKYSFVDGRESAMVAARSTSDFLDPGCIISGNQNPNFSRVRTITPGTVRKTPNGWMIESKAIVELI